jgi:hypothetical protein
MNLKPLIFYLFVSILWFNQSKAQSSFFVDVNINGTFPKDMQKPTNLDLIDLTPPEMTFYNITNSGKPIYYEKYTHKTGFSGQAGLSKKLSDKMNLQVGLGFQYLQYQCNNLIGFRLYDQDIANPRYFYYKYGSLSGYVPDGIFDKDTLGFHTGEIRYKDLNNDGKIDSNDKIIIENKYPIIYSNLLYVSIPVSFQYLIRPKLTVGIGFSASLLAYANQRKTGYQYAYLNLNYNAVANEENRTSFSDFNTLQMSGNLEVSYRIISNLWLISNADYYFLPSLKRNVQFAGASRNIVLSLGLKYFFIKNQNTK